MANTHIRFDWAIKKLLRNKANFSILEGFLSELLKEDLKIEQILESESNKENAFDKSNRVDILVQNTKGELILIEIQNERENDYFHRMAYGQAKLISEHIEQGEAFSKIKKVYSINIVYFNLGQGDDYVYVGKTHFKGMHTNNDLQLSAKQKEFYKVETPSDIFAIYYLLKLNSFNNIAKDSLDEWIYFLKNSEIKDEFRAKGLKEAKERMRIDSLGKNERIEYDNYVKIERIKQNEIETAIEDGKDLAAKIFLPLIEENKKKIEEERKQKEEERKQKEEERKQKEEIQEALKKTILQLQILGVEIEKIAEIVGKSIDEIQTLLK